MKRTTLIIIGIIVLGIGGYVAGNVLKSSGTSANTTPLSQASSASVQPERSAEIYGKIKSVVGNEVTITKSDTSLDPTINMTPEDKRAYMQGLDEAERTKLKEDLLNASLGDVKVVMNVGIPMVKKTAQGPTAPTVDASLADLKVGGVISVWLDNTVTERNVAEFVKITFTN